ncbi:aldehyde:ferredoxin oxidoreductase [Thermococci archaeon]|nr:MAG: aldehyde:ferredoxin oxidoreductase [Thermococci archaeon]
MLYKEYINILKINLTEKTTKIEKREDLFEYLGGIGIAVKLLDEECKKKKNALSPDQPIIFAIGPLSTIFPCMTKTVAVFKSPLTGEYGESYAGGRLASSMRFSGYDAIVLEGRSEDPVYLSIHNKKIRFKNAETLWGLPNKVTGRVIRELERGRGYRSIIRIGAAGENLVRYASVNVDSYRHFGRLGLGAVMGSKNLKGMIISGKKSYPIQNFQDYIKLYKKINTMVTETDKMKKYHDLGTAKNIIPLNEMKSLPTRNLQKSSFEDAEKISGENFGDEVLMRKEACVGCPIGCIHIGMLKRQFAPDHEYEFTQVNYDYELIFALGTMLEIDNPSDILELIEKTEEKGLDAMSTGVCLAWATEALEKGIISEKETKYKLSFGNKKNYLDFIKSLVNQENDFFKALSKGVAYASKIYGGEEFALSLGGNEIAGYHTGYANILGLTFSARHSHLSGGYAVDQKLKEINSEKIVENLLNEEKNRCIYETLIMCLFSRGIYDLKLVSQALKSIGINKNEEDLEILGEEIFKMKMKIKREMGYDPNKIKIPERFFETETLHGKLERDKMKEMIEIYKNKI